MKLHKKYQALLDHGEEQQLPDIANIRLCFQTLSLSHAIDRDCATQLAPYGLSEGRFVLLFLLQAAPQGLSPNTLAEKAGVSRATITGLLDGLEQSALVERHATPDDRRALCIRLTAKGKKLTREVFQQHSRWIAQLFGNLSATEQRQLSKLLNKVANNMEATKE